MGFGGFAGHHLGKCSAVVKRIIVAAGFLRFFRILIGRTVKAFAAVNRKAFFCHIACFLNNPSVARQRFGLHFFAADGFGQINRDTDLFNIKQHTAVFFGIFQNFLL